MREPICLITPPSGFLLDERVFCTLGILRVAAVLEQAGHIVEHLDLSGISNFQEAVRDHAANSKAEIYGLTATTPQMPAAAKIVATIREVRPQARVILGGPHVTLVNAARKREEKLDTMRHIPVPGRRARNAFEKLGGMFDVLVCGDGEDAVFAAISPDPPKLVDADDVTSTMFLTNAKYEEVPFPARHLVDVDSYHYSIDGERALSILAQIGCPYACGFCGGRESAMLRRIRTRSTENIVSEIRHLYVTYGVKGIQMYDDELNVNKQCVELFHAIGDLGEDLGVEFKLRGFIKSQLFTDTQAEAMYRAGFRWILVGFESGSPRILENINKKATREENSQCMEIARRHGLKVKALMSIGHPGETEGTIRDTMDWLLAEKPDDFDCTIITTYPGTPYFDHAIETSPGVWTYRYPKNGDRLHAYEIDHTETSDFYKGSPDGGYRSYVFTDFLSAEDIVRLRDDMENDVRAKLNIPFNAGAPGVQYEHSMGARGPLPPNILRTTAKTVGIDLV